MKIIRSGWEAWGIGMSLGVILAVSGCRPASPDLRIESGSAEKNPVKAAQNLASDARVVTGEPAIADSKKDPAAQTADDKTGAVAVKVSY